MTIELLDIGTCVRANVSERTFDGKITRVRTYIDYIKDIEIIQTFYQVENENGEYINSIPENITIITADNK